MRLKLLEKTHCRPGHAHSVARLLFQRATHAHYAAHWYHRNVHDADWAANAFHFFCFSVKGFLPQGAWMVHVGIELTLIAVVPCMSRNLCGFSFPWTSGEHMPLP